MVLVLLGCGRTVSGDDSGLMPMRVVEPPDAGLPVSPAPLVVFRAEFNTALSCPVVGSEADLRPAAGESTIVVRTRAQEECSGAGGEWLISREAFASRDSFIGGHACYFLGQRYRQGSFFGLARVRQTAGLFSTQRGWCLVNEDGREPVSTDRTTLAIGLYETQAAAEAAQRAFGGP